MALRGNDSGPLGVYSPEQEAALQQFNSLFQGAGEGTDSAYPGPVYMGPRGAYRDPIPGYRPTREQQGWMSGEDAILEFYGWESKTRQDFIAQGKLSGLLSPEGGELEAAALWERLVGQAAFYGAQDRKMTPWDILAGYVRQSGVSESGWRQDPSNPDFQINMITGERRYIGPRFRTQTETAVNLTDPATAKAVATGVFQQLMGRDPGQGELGAWADALRSAEESAPVSRTTTTEHDPITGEIIGSDSTTSGGIDAAGRQYMAEQRVKETQEYADVQAATTYANAFENMVFGSPDLGTI